MSQQLPVFRWVSWLEPPMRCMHFTSCRGILVIAKCYYNIRRNTFVCRRRILSRKCDVPGNKTNYFLTNSNPQQQYNIPAPSSPRIYLYSSFHCSSCIVVSTVYEGAHRKCRM